MEFARLQQIQHFDRDTGRGTRELSDVVVRREIDDGIGVGRESRSIEKASHETGRSKMESRRLRGFVIPALTALGIALLSTTGRADDAHRPPTFLGKTYPVTLGQMIATSATTILQTLKPIDAPMMAIFTGEKIEIWVLGVHRTSLGARGTLATFREKAWPPLVAMIEGLYGVKLTDEDVTVIYRNRMVDNKEIMRLENGKYVAK